MISVRAREYNSTEWLIVRVYAEDDEEEARVARQVAELFPECHVQLSQDGGPWTDLEEDGE